MRPELPRDLLEVLIILERLPVPAPVPAPVEKGAGDRMIFRDVGWVETQRI